MKLCIADDSKIVLDRLVALISENKNIEIVGTALNGLSAIALIREKKPDVAILDIKMPGNSGIDVLKVVKREIPNIKVIMLTNYNSAQYREACLAAGADYFLDKSSEYNKVPRICESLISSMDVR